MEIILDKEQKLEISEEIRELIINEISIIKDSSTLSNKEWMKKREACKYLSVSNNTFDKFRYEGLPSCTVAGITLYNRNDMDEFYRGHQD